MEHNISDKNLKEAVLKMGGLTPMNPIGQCFESALHAYYASRKYELKGNIKDLALVHGIGIANMPGQEGKTIAHAWITYFASDDPEVLRAYEPTWGVVTTDAKILKDLNVKYARAYDYEQIKYEITKNNNIDIGPWDPKVLAVLGITDEN